MATAPIRRPSQKDIEALRSGVRADGKVILSQPHRLRRLQTLGYINNSFTLTAKGEGFVKDRLEELKASRSNREARQKMISLEESLVREDVVRLVNTYELDEREVDVTCARIYAEELKKWVLAARIAISCDSLRANILIRLHLPLRDYGDNPTYAASVPSYASLSTKKQIVEMTSRLIIAGDIVERLNDMLVLGQLDSQVEKEDDDD